MVRLPVSLLSAPSHHSVDSWNRELRESMGACWRVRPPRDPNPRVFYNVVPAGKVSLLGVSVSSAITYDSVPDESATVGNRIFYIHMGNATNRMTMDGTQVVQVPGECLLGDSIVHTTSACDVPHSTLCAGIPADMLRNHLPCPERYVGKHLDRNSSYSGIVATILSSLYRMSTIDTAASDRDIVTDGMLRVFSNWCSVSSSSDCSPDDDDRVCYQHIKRLINSSIRDPLLSVESIAERTGVSTRYLQILFSRENDCVSHYIRRERLRGCLLDLRRARRASTSITDIAFSWGFNSASHFSFIFKNEFGMTAREYRRLDARQMPETLVGRLAGLLVIASAPNID